MVESEALCVPSLTTHVLVHCVPSLTTHVLVSVTFAQNPYHALSSFSRQFVAPSAEYNLDTVAGASRSHSLIWGAASTAPLTAAFFVPR